MELDHEFPCPYCGETLSLRLEPGAGRRQDFVYDCEVCCKPIHIRIQFIREDDFEFSAEAES